MLNILSIAILKLYDIIYIINGGKMATNNIRHFSEQTKKDILKAKEHKLDSLGEFYFNKDEKSVAELIQFAQSLSYDPGVLHTAEEWKELTDNRYGYPMDNIAPYCDDGSITGYALKPNNLNFKKFIFPQTLNYIPGTPICNKNEKSPRKDKILTMLGNKFNINFQFLPTLSNKTEPYKVSHKPFTNKTNLTFFNNGSLNDFVVIAVSCYVAVEKSFNSINKKNIFNEVEQACIIKLATIGLIRSLNLENPEVAFNLDEALKLDFFTTLSMLNGKRHDVVSNITHGTKTLLNNIIDYLKLDNEKIKENLNSIGLVSNNSNVNVLSSDIIFNVNNFEKFSKKHFNIKTNEKDNKKITELKTKTKALKSADKIKKELETFIPHYVKNLLLTNNNKEAFYEKNNKYDINTKALVEYVLKKDSQNKNHNYSYQARSIVSSIAKLFDNLLIPSIITLTKNYVDANYKNLKSDKFEDVFNASVRKFDKIKNLKLANKNLENIYFVRNSFKNLVKNTLEIPKENINQDNTIEFC